MGNHEEAFQAYNQIMSNYILIQDSGHVRLNAKYRAISGLHKHCTSSPEEAAGTMYMCPRPYPRTDQLIPPPRTIHLHPTPAPNQPESPPCGRAPPPSWHLRAAPSGWPRPAARSITDLEGEQSKWPTGAQLATAAAGEPAGVLGRLGAPILRCSGHARLVFGSMLAVSAMELISLPRHAGHRRLGRVLQVIQRGSDRGRLVFPGPPWPGSMSRPARSMDLTCGALLPHPLALLVRVLEVALNLDRDTRLILERAVRMLDVEQGCCGHAERLRRGRNRGGEVPDPMGEAWCVGGGGGWAVDVQHTFLFYGTTTCSSTPFSLLPLHHALPHPLPHRSQNQQLVLHQEASLVDEVVGQDDRGEDVDRVIVLHVDLVRVKREPRTSQGQPEIWDSDQGSGQ